MCCCFLIPVCCRTQLNGTSLPVSVDELVLAAGPVAMQVGVIKLIS